MPFRVGDRPLAGGGFAADRALPDGRPSADRSTLARRDGTGRRLLSAS